MIELHTWNTPNGRKVSVALEEMGLKYQVKVIDITKEQQFHPEFLAISPNNRIPAIVDTDGPGGSKLSVFESGAILVYLAEKSGLFLPQDVRGRVAVMEWLMWQMGGFGPMLGQVHHFLTVNAADQAYGLARYTKETKRLYGVLDRRLEKVEYVAGSALSIADFAIIGWAWRHERHKVSLDEFPSVKRWHEAMMARPATKRGFEVALS